MWIGTWGDLPFGGEKVKAMIFCCGFKGLQLVMRGEIKIQITNRIIQKLIIIQLRFSKISSKVKNSNEIVARMLYPPMLSTKTIQHNVNYYNKFGQDFINCSFFKIF